MPGAGGADAAGRSLVVDARGLMQSGIGRYLREVLSRLLDDPRFSQLSLLGKPAELSGFLAGRAGASRVRVVSFPYGFYSIPAQGHWLALAARGALRADAAFFPHYDIPLLGIPGRSVVTVHDLIHFKLPELFPRWRLAAAGFVLRRAVARAQRVVVVSEATGRDLVERFPDFREKVTVIPNGGSAALSAAPPPPARRSAEIRGLRPYLLCVGNRKPHKNWVAAVEVLARLRTEFPEMKLVLVGREFGEGDAVAERARALGVESSVLELGAVPDAELRELYQQTECLLFPSLYEGFGLPVLEAMALGAPVVASDRSSIPEVVGDAGALVDPTDWTTMAAEVRRLVQDSALREERVRLGRERAAGFTWERTAVRTADVLWEVAASRAGSGVSREHP